MVLCIGYVVGILFIFHFCVNDDDRGGSWPMYLSIYLSCPSYDLDLDDGSERI